jgi:hypothetical protein
VASANFLFDEENIIGWLVLIWCERKNITAGWLFLHTTHQFNYIFIMWQFS